MPLAIRGFNPIWSEFDLQGNLFDDTFYLFVLQNTIPYLPAIVWHDPDMNTPWTQPIQFLGNGTLPVDIYWDPDTVYRLEFRQGDTQNDPLIYEVDNYIPGSSGSTPVDTIATTSSNQITNPQFESVNFASPYTLAATDPDPIQIGPGWFLEVAGSGSVTINQVPFNNAQVTPSNAPYALELILSGWTSGSVHLVQRFEQNGVLWAKKTVSTAITAAITGPSVLIGATLVDSNGTSIATILPANTEVNESFNEYTGYGTLLASTNPDVPPAAYIDYKLALPSNVTIYVTSIQVIVQDTIAQPSFTQDSINRQIDHLFHVYKDTIFFKPIPSLLTAWDFPLNPAQFGITSFTTTPIYVWDQTICGSVVGTVNVTRLATTDAMKFTTTQNTEAFFMLQYLEDAEAVKTTMSQLSVLIDAYALIHGSVNVKAYLYYSSAGGTIPPLSGSPATIGTLAASGVFTLNGTTGANWTAVPLFNGYTNTGTLSTSILNDPIIFNGFDGTSNIGINAAHNFAIVVTFKVPTAGTTIQVNSIACVPGSIATKPAPQTQDEVLRECQYYFQSSFPLGTAPVSGTFTGNAPTYAFQQTVAGQDSRFVVTFAGQTRAIPTITTYSPGTTGANIYNFTRSSAYDTTVVSNISVRGFIMTGDGHAGSQILDLIGINWTADSRLAKV
jgi:hypothetical protein